MYALGLRVRVLGGGGAENKIGQNEMLNAVQPDLVTGGEVGKGFISRMGVFWVLYFSFNGRANLESRRGLVGFVVPEFGVVRPMWCCSC